MHRALRVPARRDAAIVPKIDDALALQKLQVRIQLGAQDLVLARAAGEHLDALAHTLFSRRFPASSTMLLSNPWNIYFQNLVASSYLSELL